MGQFTISMAIFNSFLYVYQRVFGAIIAALPQADPGVVDLKNSGCSALHLAARIGDCEVQTRKGMEKASHQPKKKRKNAMKNMEEDLVYQNDVIFIIWKILSIKMMWYSQYGRSCLSKWCDIHNMEDLVYKKWCDIHNMEEDLVYQKWCDIHNMEEDLVYQKWCDIHNMEEDLVYQNDVIFIIWKILSIKNMWYS